jgi:hypothetical protein
MPERFLLLVLTFGLTLSAIGAIEGPGSERAPEPVASRWIDWQRGRFVIQVVVETAPPPAPKTRYDAEQRIADLIPNIFADEVAKVCLDSSRQIGDSYREGGGILEKLKELALSGKRESASYAADMKSVRIVYTFPIYGEDGLLSFYLTHTRPFPIRRVLGFVSVKEFTGIVIYAKGEYPLHGKNRNGSVKPSLFPKIFDEEMNEVFQKQNCDPESLKRWGMAQYTDSLNLERFSQRIGRFPLHIMARGIYGINNTDLIIPTDDAQKILALEENRNLLVQGRVLILVD